MDKRDGGKGKDSKEKPNVNGMDGIIRPERRKWISEPMILKTHMQALRQMAKNVGLLGNLNPPYNDHAELQGNNEGCERQEAMEPVAHCSTSNAPAKASGTRVKQEPHSPEVVENAPTKATEGLDRQTGTEEPVAGAQCSTSKASGSVMKQEPCAQETDGSEMVENAPDPSLKRQTEEAVAHCSTSKIPETQEGRNKNTVKMFDINNACLHPRILLERLEDMKLNTTEEFPDSSDDETEKKQKNKKQIKKKKKPGPKKTKKKIKKKKAQPEVNESDENVPAEENENEFHENASSEEEETGKKKTFDKFMKRAFETKKKQGDAFTGNHKQRIMTKLAISEDDFERIHKIISPATFTVYGETYQDESVAIGGFMPVLAPPIPNLEQLRLKSLSVFVSHSEDPTGFQWRSNNVQQQIDDDIAHDNFQRRMRQQTEDYKNGDPNCLNKNEEFIIELSFFLGGHPDETLSPEVKMHIEPKLAFKLELLGSQTIAELMDSLRCENDFLPMQDVAHPDEEFDLEKFTTNPNKAAMLMIDDFVYSDRRGPGSINFEEYINQWTSLPPYKGIGQYKSGDINVQLQDIKLRLGYPYLYVHQGMCEHVICFNKSRLMLKEDEHRRSKYPRVSTPGNFKNVYCRIDNERLAKWAVVDCQEFPESPMMVCTQCVKMYCYDDEKRKRGDFKLFPFRQLVNELIC